ncbi:hypothetical protein ACROYT_G007385 [Oculina patagonica]
MVTGKLHIVLILVIVYIQGTVAGNFFKMYPGEKTTCRCTRQGYNTSIGIDITYWYVTEDVGRCEEICHKNNVPTEGNTKGYSCNPTEMLSKSYQLIGDTKHKSIIQKCGYQHTSGPCRRLSLYKTFFKGTTYSRRHDVGSCVGFCGIDGHECKAIDSRKKVVTGPNGDLSVSVIKKCGCVRPGCQRVAFREVYKRKTEKGWIQEEKDVGMCVGTGCPDFCGYCFDRNQSTADSKCKYCLSYKAGACIATNYTTEAVYTGDFKSKKIHIIKECRCNSE